MSAGAGHRGTKAWDDENQARLPGHVSGMAARTALASAAAGSVRVVTGRAVLAKGQAELLSSN